MRLRSPLLIVLVAAGLGLLIYGPALGLPLFLDDVNHFRWLSTFSAVDIWTTAGGYPFWRPVSFTVFKILWFLQGGYHALTLHTLLVSLHVVNAALVGLLARRLARQDWAGVIGAALMLVFPFSYQAVTLVGSIFHPLLVLGTASAALLALRYLERGGRGALVGAWLAAFVATFSHENGILVPFLVGLVLAGADLKRNRRQAVLLLAPMFAVAGLYLFLWLSIPKSLDSGGVAWAGLGPKLAYFAQGLVYPLSALARPLATDEEAASRIIGLLTAAGIGAALLALRRWSGPNLAAAVSGLAWAALTAGPSSLLLDRPYLLSGPRLLYFSSAGVALFWSVWLGGVLTRRARRVLRVVGAAVLSAFLLVGALFILRRMTDAQRMGAYYWELIHSMQNEPGQPALVVNAPSYLAPRQAAFLLGAEGTTFLADYFEFSDFVWVNTGLKLPMKTVAFQNTLVENQHLIFSPRGPWALTWEALETALDSAQVIFSTRFIGDDFSLGRVGERPPTFAGAPLAQYPVVTLWHGEVSAQRKRLTLEWEVTGSASANVYVHVFCQGQFSGAFDGPPLGGLHPLDRWKVGERWLDERAIAIPCPGLAQVRVGLYRPDTNQRFSFTRPDGTTADGVEIPVNP